LQGWSPIYIWPRVSVPAKRALPPWALLRRAFSA